MSDKKVPETEQSVQDPELAELLDSALEDLTKGIEKKEAKKEVVDNATAEEASNAQEWSEEFIKSAAKQFESNMAKIIGSATNQDIGSVPSGQIEMNLQKMAEAAAQVISNPQEMVPTAASNDFSATITQTLQNLSLGAENLQNPFSDQDLMNMFSGESDNSFLPFMQGMMQSILSKEVLYPSLKDILDKYPRWLEENKPKIEESEYERYTKQKNLMQEVCQELEKEKDTDDEATKKTRFDTVLTLMHKMQDLGQPPSEIVGDMGPQIQFDERGQPIIPEGIDINNLESLCSIM